MQQTFEDFLISTFNEEHPEVETSKSIWNLNYQQWLRRTDLDVLIAYAEKWHSVRMLEITNEVIQQWGN